MAKFVSKTKNNQICSLTVTNLPLNLITGDVRRDLIAEIEAAIADDDVSVIVLKPNVKHASKVDLAKLAARGDEKPTLATLCDTIENSPKPVVSLVYGPTQGGAFEIACASHYRIAATNTKAACAEIKFGLIPGGGVLQRSARLLGAARSLNLALTGDVVPVEELQKSEFADLWVEREISDRAEEFISEFPIKDMKPRRTEHERQGLTDFKGFQSTIAAARAATPSVQTLAFAKCIDCVEVALLLPYEAGLAFEAEAYADCKSNNAHFGLTRSVVSQHTATRGSVVSGEVRRVEEISVIGATPAGQQIAKLAMDQGLAVKLIDPVAAKLDAAQASLSSSLDSALTRNAISVEARAARLAALTISSDLETCASSDVILETGLDDLKTKRAIFSHLARYAKPDAVLATTSAFVDLGEIAEGSPRRDDIISLNFSKPPLNTDLVEFAHLDETRPVISATAMAAARALGKTPILVGSRAGRVGPRLQAALRYAASEMICLGATPAQVDHIMQGFGFPLGPFQHMDQQGLDLVMQERRVMHALLGESVPAIDVVDQLVDAGWLGVSTNCGFYVYDEGVGSQNPDVEAIIVQIQRARGFQPRRISAGEIRRRLWIALCNHGARLIEEGVAASADVIDTICVMGYGYPARRGGPMATVERAGLAEVVRDLNLLGQENAFWAPCQLMKDANLNGQRFAREFTL